MTVKEAIAEIKKIAKRCDYAGSLSEKALNECAEVYLGCCNESGMPKPRSYMRSGENHKPTALSEMQWLLVRTPSFKAWFGKSVVVDENGDPKVMYHGTSKGAIEKFDVGFIERDKVAMTLWAGPGFYFTDDHKAAEIYAKKDGTINEVFLRLENPLVVDETGNAEVYADHITRREAEAIMMDGDNTQWLDHSLCNELARLTGKSKQVFKEMTREKRVEAYVRELKTDVVKLKCVANAYGSKSQKRMLAAICKHTGRDGVIHRITPEVSEWVVYDPKAIKSANANDGDFSVGKAAVQDASEGEENDMKKVCNILMKIGATMNKNGDMNTLVKALEKIRDAAPSQETTAATDELDSQGKWITIHPNNSEKGRPIHLNKEGHIDSEGHLSNAIKNKGGSAQGKGKSEPQNKTEEPKKPSYKYFANAQEANKALQEHGTPTYSWQDDNGEHYENASEKLATKIIKDKIKACEKDLPFDKAPGFNNVKHLLRVWNGEVTRPEVGVGGLDYDRITIKGNVKAMGNEITASKKDAIAKVSDFYKSYAIQLAHKMGLNVNESDIEIHSEDWMNAPSVTVSLKIADHVNGLKSEIISELKAASEETGYKYKTKAELEAEKNASDEKKAEHYNATLTGDKLGYFKKEGVKAFEDIEDAINKAKEKGKPLTTRFEVNDYEDADEHYYHAMRSLVKNYGGTIHYEDSPEWDEDAEENNYGYARGFTASFPADAAHALYTAISVDDKYHGSMAMPYVK